VDLTIRMDVADDSSPSGSRHLAYVIRRTVPLRHDLNAKSFKLDIVCTGEFCD
jgi:hypothetical protein